MIESKNRIAPNALFAFAFSMLLYGYGEYFLIHYLSRHGWQQSPMPIRIGFIGWTALGIYELIKYAWLIAGHERIVLQSQDFEIKRGLAGFWLSKKYRLNEIQEFTDHRKPFINQGWKAKFEIRYGRFSFILGKKRINFGIGLSDDQSSQVADHFKSGEMKQT